VLRPDRHRYKGPFHAGLPAERVGKLGDEGKWSCMLVRVAKKDAWRMQYTFDIGDEVLVRNSTAEVRRHLEI
jgi:hypothetical protein